MKNLTPVQIKKQNKMTTYQTPKVPQDLIDTLTKQQQDGIITKQQFLDILKDLYNPKNY